MRGRARVGGVELARHAPGKESLAPGLDRLLHRARHQHRLAGSGDRSVHQHAIAAQLHRNGGVRGRAHAGIDQHRHLGVVDDQAQIPRVEDAHAGANQGGQRHHRHTADVFQHPGLDGVVGAVHHDLEALLDQSFGRFQGLGHVREQVARVAQDLELDQVMAAILG